MLHYTLCRFPGCQCAANTAFSPGEDETLPASQAARPAVQIPANPIERAPVLSEALRLLQSHRQVYVPEAQRGARAPHKHLNIVSRLKQK